MPGISVSRIPIPFNGGGGFNAAAYWATRTPSALNVTSQTDTTIDFAWTAGADEPEGYKLQISSDGVTYTDKTTVAGNVTTAQATGLTAGVLYYFKVVAYSGTNESDPTNIYDTRFKITVDTTKVGSANNTFVLPTSGVGTYNYYVDWGDGGAEDHIEVNTSQTKVYAASGTYQIKIRGTFPRIYFNNAGDKAKLMFIDNWGNIRWSEMSFAFRGCSNMQGRYLDVPNFSNVTIYQYMFSSCSTFNYSVANFITASAKNIKDLLSYCSLFNQSVATWDVSNVEYMNSLFSSCFDFNQSVATWDVSNVKDMSSLFFRCSKFNQSLVTFNTANVQKFNQMLQEAASFKQSLTTFSLASATDMSSMIHAANINATGTTTNYDATLVAWAAQNPPNSLTFSGGTSKYGEGLVDNGTTDGVAANKLIQSGQNFLTTVTIGDVVRNVTDGTYAFVTAIDSDTQLSISADIMASGEVYRIQHGDGAKARASLIIDHLWTITDGGAL